MENIDITEMNLNDYEAACQLWCNSSGISLSSADSKENIAKFLNHNPELCFVARHAGKLVGAVLCGSDSRRGYLYHLAVDPLFRGTGIGKELTARVLNTLRARGIQRCHIFVMSENIEGKKFWEKIGWTKRNELFVMSYNL